MPADKAGRVAHVYADDGRCVFDGTAVCYTLALPAGVEAGTAAEGRDGVIA